MRSIVMCLLVVATGLSLTGCPSQQYDLVGTSWTVSVNDANEETVPHLAGTWKFYSDGTLQINSYINGTYTVDGSNVEFEAEYSHSGSLMGHLFSDAYSISGTLVYDGKALTGTGDYSVETTDSSPSGSDYSDSGTCTINASVTTSSADVRWIFVLVMLVLGLFSLL